MPSSRLWMWLDDNMLFLFSCLLRPTLLNLRASEPANRRLMKVFVTPGVGSLLSAVDGQTDSESAMSLHDTFEKS
eukprot:s187_g28.t1